MALKSSKFPLLRFLLLFFSIGIQLFGFTEAIHETNPSKQMADITQNFAEKLYLEVTKQSDKSGNVVISPSSIQTALAMVAMGARGNTLKELEETLKIAINDPAWREKMEKAINDSHQSKEKEGVVKEITNSLLISDQLHVNPEFKSELKKLFHADAELVDFTKPEVVRSDLNKRVDNQTHGLIKEALPEDFICPDTAMILSNVLYFKGSWLKPFEKQATSIRPFFPDGVHQVDAQMMHMYEEEFKVADLSDLNAKSIYLPYKDKRHGMLLILPNERNGLNETENRLFTSGLTPNKLLERMHHEDVVLSLPRFKVTFKSHLNGILKKMGIVDLFSKALDLSGVCAETNLKVDALHESIVEVNEEGTEAAAFTGVKVVFYSSGFSKPPFVFNADHPFLFYLIDTENDSMPLFIGRVNNPLSV